MAIRRSGKVKGTGEAMTAHITAAIVTAMGWSEYREDIQELVGYFLKGAAYAEYRSAYDVAYVHRLREGDETGRDTIILFVRHGEIMRRHSTETAAPRISREVQQVL